MLGFGFFWCSSGPSVFFLVSQPKETHRRARFISIIPLRYAQRIWAWPNGSLVPLDPGPYGNYIVRANATLQLRSGVYSYWGLTIEPNAVVVADVSQGPVWVYIHQGPAIFRGPFVTEDPSRLFVGVPGGTFESAEVLLGDQFTATLVAPNSNVIADMRGGTKLLGSFFVRTFELHQGRFLERLAFQHPWVPTCSSGFEGCF